MCFSMNSLMSMRVMRLLVVEEELGERLGELGLSDAASGRGRGSEPIGLPGSRRPTRPRRTAFDDGAHRLVLTDDARARGAPPS